MSKLLPISLFSHGIKTHQRTVNTEQIKCGVIVRHHYESLGRKISPGFEDAFTRKEGAGAAGADATCCSLHCPLWRLGLD